MDEGQTLSFFDNPEIRLTEEYAQTLQGSLQGLRFRLDGLGESFESRDMIEIVEKLPFSPPNYAKWRQSGREEEVEIIIPFIRQQPIDEQLASLYWTLPSDSFIRLLELMPSISPRNGITALLHVCHIDHIQRCYEALSYTWDDWWTHSADETILDGGYITCNGIRFKVGLNLAMALRRLRRDTTPRILWIDAICINQEDKVERSNQIRMMASIYENAFQVLVWLGNDEQLRGSKIPVTETEPYKAFSAVCAVVNTWTRRFHRDSDVQLPLAEHSPGLVQPPVAEIRVMTAEDVRWGEILQLYHQRWFGRLWVIQEIALARKATVFWADCEISWELIGLAACILRTNWRRIAFEKTRRPQRQVLMGVMNAYLMYRISMSQNLFDPLHFTFHQLLLLTRQFRCKDGRDKIFGLLALPTIDGVNSRIIVDYMMSLPDLYIQLARLLIAQSGSLSLLSAVYDTTYDRSMPSWVPRWHVDPQRQFDGPQTLLPLEPHPDFAAAAGRLLELQHPEDITISGGWADTSCLSITVRGVIVEPIIAFHRNRTVPTTVGDLLGFGDSPALWARRLRGELEILDLGMALKRGRWTRPKLENLALTLSAGKTWYGLPVNSSEEERRAHIASFARCLVVERTISILWVLASDAFARPDRGRECPSGGNDEEECDGDDDGAIITAEEVKKMAEGGNMELFLDACSTACTHRLLFTSKGGRQGVGPKETQEGDVICVLYGADIPFVIRPKGEGYLLIGECYVHDLMHGEAISMASRKDSGVRETWIQLV